MDTQERPKMTKMNLIWGGEDEKLGEEAHQDQHVGMVGNNVAEADGQAGDADEVEGGEVGPAGRRTEEGRSSDCLKEGPREG